MDSVCVCVYVCLFSEVSVRVSQSMCVSLELVTVHLSEVEKVKAYVGEK